MLPSHTKASHKISIHKVENGEKKEEEEKYNHRIS